MTTMGVEVAHTERALPMNVPTYVYRYPTAPRVQLAAVKTGLFHPQLPTFRRMAMDTDSNKLPYEHCQTSVSLGKDVFNKATTSLFSPQERKLNCAQVTETGRELHRHYTTPVELKNTRMEWSNFLNKSPERYQIRLAELAENKDLPYSGYAVRYIRPEITSSWRYCLRQEPSVAHGTQMPVPAKICSRYRDTNPQYNRNITTKTWR